MTVYKYICTKNRGPISSEATAPIAVGYAGVTPAEEAADQTAMASYVNNIAQHEMVNQQKFEKENNASENEKCSITGRTNLHKMTAKI